MKMRPFGRLLGWETAVRRVSQAIEPITRTEEVSVSLAVGRTASRAYRARSPVPPFARATWDGYALRAQSTRAARADHAVRFTLVGEVFAEAAFRGRLGPFEAVAIATGGALPAGADAVVRFEDVQIRRGNLEVRTPLRRGDRLAQRGEDLRAGSLVVRSGQQLTAPDLGALALTGQGRIAVWARPVVSILPNGNELVAPGGRLKPGSIFEANNATLAAVAAASGCEARPLLPVRDDPRAIEVALRRALAASDLVLVTGGSSVGERDFLPSIFPKLGKLLFHGIAIRPGKPTLAVRVGKKVVVGMPGHPTSCLSNGYWLLLPALRKLARRTGPGWSHASVQLTVDVDLPTSSMATVIPFDVSHGHARPTFRDSSAITSLGRANAFLVWPPGRPMPVARQILTVNLLPYPLGRAPGV
ncbi:MAG: molybdopterin molybdotransferase MoeA [Thermoplasmata archaeon]|nr:molybdopterin molybdotransferase MoeA [Thermoplasmata archaeon]